LPVLVGGDGFYLENIFQPAATLTIPPEPASSGSSGAAIGRFSLKQQLESLDPAKWQQMNHSDRHNPRRLIRAIEVAPPIKNGVSPGHRLPVAAGAASGSALQPDQASLADRIRARVKTRIKAGFPAEVDSLIRRYPDFFSLPAANTLGYAQWQPV
jgi:tRNA A37 N6-isopentenylltransferase MiaA